MASTHSRQSKLSAFKRLNSPARHVVESLESRRLLSAVSFVGTVSGDFATPGNWSTGLVPTAADDVTINAGAGITVTIFAGEFPTINSLTTNSPVVVAGVLTVMGANVTLNGASLAIDASGGQGDIIFQAGGTLGGTGTVSMQGTGELIAASGTLTIASGITITGGGGSMAASGIIGGSTPNTVSVINNGTIDAGSMDLFLLDLTNNGTLAAADGGALLFEGACSLDATGAVNLGIDLLGSGVLEFITSPGMPSSLGGTLNIHLDNGFVPGQDQPYPILVNPSGADLNGSFATINGLTLPGVVFTPATTAMGITLTANQTGTTGTSATTLSLLSSLPIASVGDLITFTATVGTVTGDSPAATGAVSFLVNGVLIATENLDVTGNATFADSFLPSGAYAITATYAGDSFYAAGVAAPITQTINGILPANIGGLDPTFGTGGLAFHDVGFSSTSDLLLQPDGKSVIVGTVGASPSDLFGLTRYNADGSLDASFGANGVADPNLAGDDQAAAGYFLPSGDILVAGTATTFANGVSAGSQFALAEYTPAGALDPSFGAGAGFVLTSFSAVPGTLSNDLAHAIVVSPAGVIFVGGSSDAAGHGQDFAIAAYNADGSPATGFGGNGTVLLDFTGGNDSIASLALQPKGGLLAAGSTFDSGGAVGSVALASFLPNGALDTRFGNKGTVTTSVRGVDDSASSVAIDPKGKIVVGGFSATGSVAAGTMSSDFLVLRYTSAGKLDGTFNGKGSIVTTFNQPAAVTRVLANADGTIVASGKTSPTLNALDPSSLELAVARYTAKGQLDTSFNQSGTAIFNLASAASTESLHPSSGPIEQPARLVAFDATSDLMAAFMQLTESDQGVIAMNTGGQLLDVGSSGVNTVEAAIIAMGIDLAAAVLSKFPNAVVGGAKGMISVQITETGTEIFGGGVTINLSASPFQNATGQTPFQSFPENLKLKQSQAKTFKFKFLFPSSMADGNYYVQATIDTGAVRDLNVANNTASTAATVDIAKPFIDLAATGLLAPTLVGAKPAVVSFTVTNDGNVPTPSTPSSVQFLVSTDGTLTGAIPVATIAFKPNLKPSLSRAFKSKVALPAGIPAGAYFLLALIDPANVFGDPNTSNNLAVGGSPFVVG